MLIHELSDIIVFFFWLFVKPAKDCQALIFNYFIKVSINLGMLLKEPKAPLKKVCLNFILS